jgi:signal transduction histidine kinase
MNMRLKLIASFILIVLTAIGIFIVVTVRQTAQELNNFIERKGLTGGEQVVRALEDYYEAHHSWMGVQEVLRSSPHTPRFKMWGQGMGANQRAAPEAPSLNLRLADVSGRLMAHTMEGLLPRDQTLTQFELRQAVPLEVDGETVGYLVADGGPGFTPANQINLLSRLNQAALVAVVIAGVVAVALALFLSFSLVRPIRALTQAASNMAAGDLSQRVQVKGNDELAALGQTFNEMAESLQHAEEQRKAMTADIAHELRTPLAVQRAHLEAIEDGVYPLNADSLATIEEQNQMLTRLVEDLRTLALADAGQLTLQKSATDFPELIRKVAERYKHQADGRGIKIQLNLEDCPPFLVDPQRIQQILHNLITNALRYTPDGGRIHGDLSLRSSGEPGGGVLQQYAILAVRDTGAGIPPEVLPSIFDRFYRGGKSRARSEGGTGLGLSIARKLAQAHGGDLTAANLPEGGAEFKLTLPMKYQA